MKLVTLTGPSGSGKTTLLNNLCDHHGFAPVISHTTRDIREGERNGYDYHFITKEVFDKMWADGLLVESVEFNGNSYGVSIAEIEKVYHGGKKPILIVEPRGLAQVKTYFKGSPIEVVSVFVTAKLETLIHRYLQRMVATGVSKGEAEVAYNAKRITSIFTESETWGSHDYVLKAMNNDTPQFSKIIAIILSFTHDEEVEHDNQSGSTEEV